MIPRSIGNHVLAIAALVVFAYEGFRQMYQAKHVDRLEREGKITAESAARIRKKPMKLIGWTLIACGIAFFAKFWFGIF